MTRGADRDYDKLTSLLHWKPDTATITIADLDQIYHRLFSPLGAPRNHPGAVVDLIQNEAKKCTTAGVGVNFENKIVLAIAIRLCAEKFMIAQIANPTFVNAITRNQTPILFKEFRRLFPTKSEAIRILNDVMLTTPENIHLNSFMYEPILDMSDEHLRGLYNEVLSLK